MPSVTEADRKLLEDAAKLPGAFYGGRLYSMTALLALAEQREAFEREIATLRVQQQPRSGLTTQYGRVIMLVVVLTGVLAGMLLEQRTRVRPSPSPTAISPRVVVPIAAAGAPLSVATLPPVVSAGLAARPNGAIRPIARTIRRDDRTKQQETEASLLVESHQTASEPTSSSFAKTDQIAASIDPPVTQFAVPVIPAIVERSHNKRERQEAVDLLRALRAR